MAINTAAFNAPRTATISAQTVFDVFEDHDKTEGRGAQTLRYTIDSQTHANVLAAGLGVMGTPGRIDKREVLTITLDGGAVYYVPLHSLRFASGVDARAIIRARAMLKLTPEERAAFI